MLHELLDHWIICWLGWVEHGGYWGVIVLMAMESSIFPVPSEVVIPPAAILAISSGKMSLTGVILAGTFGSWLGSAITYYVSLAVGRPLVERYGKFFFIPAEKLERAERFIRRYEAGGIFFARLLPVLRHLISIPAGIIRMGFLKFSILTVLGAAIWCSILAKLGAKIGEGLPKGEALDAVQLVKAVKAEFPLVIGVVFVIGILYFLVMKVTASKSSISA